ncbi:hypothetical protein G3T14_02420 [Methylobacterium sp. BTF04]|uniref:hypothetical protein n=1 Tax=Methylobacterium sp. BTF04 TaxID=2708300 RepID=UPI0013D330E7|nr:hypothetical protein [Methylobacterium sp. BTF04]NEU10986.1 hypothetical protein [Methylobacterium sp. BTF04]
MTSTPRSTILRSLAVVCALFGAMMFATPKSAQAAPAIVSTEVAGPAAGLTHVQYGGYAHHRGHHHHRHYGHRRHFGHHYGHHRGHGYGRHFGHHRGHHHGRRHFY